MKRVSFYALREDLLLVLGDIEKKHRLRYLDTRDFRSPHPKEWSHAEEIFGLSRARHETGTNGASYMIVKEGTEAIQALSVMYDGTKRFDLYDVNNPDCVRVMPAGEWRNNIILAGEFVTMWNTPAAQQLIRAAYARIRKHFTKVGYHYWVGPQALRRFQSGARLTIAEQSPPEFDLKDPSLPEAVRTEERISAPREDFKTMSTEEALNSLSRQARVRPIRWR